MLKERSVEEKQAFLLGVVNQMKTHTAASITQICGNVDDTTGELIGTGTFVSLPDGPYLVTAQHVASELFTSNQDGTRKYASGLSHFVGTTNTVRSITSPWVTLDSPKDIAVTRVNPMDIQEKEVVPLRVDQFALNSQNLNDDLYFVHGFPGKYSHFTTLLGRGLFSRSLPYGCFLESSQWAGFDESLHFAVSYPPDDLIDERGLPLNRPDPGGLSGSVVWKANLVGTEGDWTPERARVVGIAHRFDQEARCIVVTRIEYLKGLLLHVLRSNFAYFRWLGRGRPMWDALDDWTAAENAIPTLIGM